MGVSQFWTPPERGKGSENYRFRRTSFVNGPLAIGVIVPCQIDYVVKEIVAVRFSFDLSKFASL